MNEFKGTEGPWEKDGVEIRGVTQHQSECICVMNPGFEREDAFMLAAAPTMFAALAEVVRDVQAVHEAAGIPLPYWFADCEASIAKALGKDQ